MRLLLIAIGSLFFSFLILISIRFWGQAQKFESYNHVALKQTPPIIFNVGSNFLNIDTHPQTGEFLVGNTPVETYLEQIHNNCTVLNFKANLPAIHTHIEKFLNKNNILESSCVILMAESRNVTEALKNLIPRFIYASTKAENMKLLSMQSMGLLPAAKIQSDIIFIEPFDKHGRTLLSDDFVNEVLRQNKKIIVGPFKSQQEQQSYFETYSRWSLYGAWLE